VGKGDAVIKVAYRVSKDHPIVMLSMNDMQIFHDQLKPIRNNRLAIALGTSFLMGLIVLALFMTYVRYEESAVETENRTKAISSHLMMTEFSPKGVITNVNDRLVEVSGYAKEELIGQPYQVFDYEFSSLELSKSLFASIESGKIWQGVYRRRKKSGEFYWVNATIIPFTDVWGKVIRYSAYYTDITQAISMREKFENERRMREELAIVNRDLVKDSNTDPLTRLFNRRAFDAFISQAIKSAKERTQPISILMLDLDFFKKVNDTYGHAGGDEVLKESGRRWLAQIRGSDMLARIGGEEFCVVLPETTMAQAELVAEKIILATRENLFTIKTPDGGSESFPVTVSIGVASTDHFPEGFSPEMFMNVADSALYRAKHGGRNQFVSQRVEVAQNI
jgi:diguanylate cyclase (GGDEF)-like protein/PAS domain S-box-containing protein